MFDFVGKRLAYNFVECHQPQQNDHNRKSLVEYDKLQSRGPSLVGGVDPSRHHDILLHSTNGCSR